MMDRHMSPTQSRHLDELRLHLKRAIKTLKVQPFQKGDRPQGILSSWTFVDAPEVGLCNGRARKNHFKATPKQVSHMQFWVDHMLRLDEEARRIVMARAAGISWRRLEEIDGRSHTTLRKIEKTALLSLLDQLNEARSVLPRDFMA